MLFTFISALAVSAITFVTAGITSEPTITLPPTPDALKEKCLKLNNITNVAELANKDLVDSLDACKGIKEEDRANLTAGAQVIYVIYTGILPQDYQKIDKLIKDKAQADKISKCVETATAKEFTTTDAQQKFGFNGTRSLVFDVDRCMLSFKLKDCIEDIFYVNSSLTVDAKATKDIFMSAFDVTSDICEEVMIREDRSHSPHSMPSIPVMVIGTTLMLLKLFICDI